MTINSLVYEKPEGQRIWVVRASGGTYVQHFKKAGIAAIGHLDDLDLSDNLIPSELDMGLIEKSLQRDPDASRSQVTSHIN